MRSDGSPYRARIKVRARKWTGEAIGAGVGTDTRNVVESPVDDADIAQCTPDHTDQLHQEDFAGRDLMHIIRGIRLVYCIRTYIAVHSQFQVLGKVKTFDDRDVSKVEEPNVGQYLSGKYKAGHDPTEDIDVDLHVGRRVDYRELHRCQYNLDTEKL